MELATSSEERAITFVETDMGTPGLSPKIDSTNLEYFFKF